MEGLINYSDKYNLKTIFTIGNGQFHPVMTDFALSIDLEHCPDGNILPSPFYRGPVDVSEDFDYLVPVGDEPLIITIDGGEPQEIPKDSVAQIEDGAKVHIVSGWAKSVNSTNPPMHEMWYNALCMERKPGGFSAIKPSTKEPTDVEQDWAKKLFPLSKNAKLFYSADIKMNHETILKDIETLQALVLDIPLEVFKGKATKEAEIATKLKVYESDGFKKGDLTTLRKAVDGYKNMITKAQAEMAEAAVSKDELIQFIREFYKFLDENNVRNSTNSKTKKGIEKLEKLIGALGDDLDTTTGMFSQYIKKNNAVQLVQNIKDFMKSTDISPSAGGGGGTTPNKVQSIINQTNKFLKEGRVALTKANRQEDMERLNQMLTVAQDAAHKNQPYPMDEIEQLTNELRALVGPTTTTAPPSVAKATGKCAKCKEKLKLVGNGMCLECAIEYIDGICDYTHQKNHYKQFADSEQKAQFEEGVLGYNSKGHSVLIAEALRKQWDDAYEALASKKNQKTFDHMVTVANKIDAFFKSFVPENSSSEEVEDDSDSNSSSSSGSFFDDDDDDEDEPTPKKRGRNDDDSVLKAMINANDEERKRIYELHQNGELKRLKILVDDLNKRNTVHYRIVYFDKNTREPNHILTAAEAPYDDKDEAETKGRSVVDRLHGTPIDFRIDIING
jgi:hypothetical protein